MTQSDPIVVWGGGAIGGTIAAYWARAGIPVLLVDIVREHVEACRTTGLAIEGKIENFTVPVQAATPGELKGSYSRIVLAVKALATADAVRQLLPHLAPEGFVVSAQNGLNETLIAEFAGRERTMGCFVNFGADWLGPGRILYGGRGEVYVGEIDGTTKPRTIEMHRLLQAFEPNAVLTGNIWGVLWSKLAYASMLFATSLNDDGMAGNFGDSARQIVFDTLGREVLDVALARGIRPATIPSFDPVAFMQGGSTASARTCLDNLAERRRNAGKTHSGFWRDLAVRKRRTEIDPLMGTVATLARESGIDTPALRTLIGLVHDVEDGRRGLSMDTFKVLLDQCARLSPTTSAAQ
ncbi:MAG: ketopantoate reductase family protein [Betaproteobacteria bacterium]|nr:ketopantoate reductase family protein [Betaproteobacteria bacterium]